MSDEVQETACLNPGFCEPICVACEAMAKEYQQKLRTPLSEAVITRLRERLKSGDVPVRTVRRREPRECPPGVHSMFDFCPGDCTEPVEDEHEIHPITLCGNVAKTLDWLRRFQASLAEPSDWSLPLTVYFVQQPDQEDTRFEVGDVLCWDGTRVRLHSSTRQGVETCESQEALMLKFGTGQITAVTDGTEEKLPSKVGRALTQEEWEAVVNEIEPETEGE